MTKEEIKKSFEMQAETDPYYAAIIKESSNGFYEALESMEFNSFEEIDRFLKGDDLF